MQEHHKEWRHVAYASRAKSNTERHYAQIEKEALAITWACEKFHTFVMGLIILVETDHKPLVLLLSTKHLELLHLVSFVSDYALVTSLTLLSIYQESYSTLQMFYLELQKVHHLTQS